MIAILEEANKRLSVQLKKNELLMAMKQNAKTLKMKYLHKRNQMKKKYIRDKMKQNRDNHHDNGLNNSVIDSLDLSIITRKESIHSLHSIGRQETNFSGFEFLKSSKNDDDKSKYNDNDEQEVDQSHSIESITNLESILSDLNNLSDEEKKKKKISSKLKTQRRNSFTGLTRNTSELENNMQLQPDNQDLKPISRKETTVSRNNNKRDLEKILQNEIKQKHKKLLKKQVQKQYPNQQGKKGGIKVYRRYRDQDEAYEKLRIPKEYLKYLPESWEEFDTQKKEYHKWLQNWYKELYSNEDFTEEEVIQKILQLNIPEIQVKIPKDESEGQGTYGIREENEW